LNISIFLFFIVIVTTGESIRKFFKTIEKFI
jgi:hypothetical protein